MKTQSKIHLFMSDGDDATALCMIDAADMVWHPLDPNMKMKTFTPRRLEEMYVFHRDGSVYIFCPQKECKPPRADLRKS